MNRLIVALCIAALAGLAWSADNAAGLDGLVAKKVERLLGVADSMQWTETEKAKLTALIVKDLEETAARRRQIAAEKAAGAVAAPKVDPMLEQLRRDAQRRKARFEVLKRTQTQYQPGRTNLNVRAMRASLAEKIAEARRGWTNALLRVEAVRGKLETRKAEYVAKRDKATLPSTKAIYQAFIDIIDELLARLEAKKEDE